MTAALTFHPDDFVLYRDAALFWAGQPGHTFVCRVLRPAGRAGHYDLLRLDLDREVPRVDAVYMRLLPPEAVMRDIDTASLADTDVLDAAAVAWLRHETDRRTTDTTSTHRELA